MVKIGLLNEIIDALVTLFADNSQGVCTCSIAASVPPNCTAVWLYLSRASGTGTISLYPDSGATAIVGTHQGSLMLPISGQNIKYSCSAAEVWTLNMIAYVIEGERKTA